MLALIVYNQLVQGESARTSVKLNQQQLEQLREQVREALEAAREAQESSGFWGAIADVLGSDLATVAQVVAIAAATVATGGAAAIALGAIAIACTLAAKYAEELGIPPELATAIAVVAAASAIASGNVGGFVQVSSAANASSAAATAGTAAAETVNVASAASTAASAAQAGQIASTARDVEQIASLVAATARGSGAVCDGVSGHYEATAVDHRANARAAKSGETLEDMDLDAALELMAQALDRRLAGATSLADIQSSQQSTDRLIIETFAGRA